MPAASASPTLQIVTVDEAALAECIGLTVAEVRHLITQHKTADRRSTLDRMVMDFISSATYKHEVDPLIDALKVIDGLSALAHKATLLLISRIEPSRLPQAGLPSVW